MNFKISGHHLEITPAITDRVKIKLERVLRHFDQVMAINVTLSVDNQKEKDKRQQAGVHIRLKGKDIFVEEHHEDLYAAIDGLVDKLDRQVLKHKSRVHSYEHDALKHHPSDGAQP